MFDTATGSLYHLFMIVAVIVAAGSSKRMGGKVKKQFIQLSDKAIVTHTVERFLAHSMIETVVLVLPPENADSYTMPSDISEPFYVTGGGAKRSDSVLNGLLKAKTVFDEKEVPQQERYILIHDGVRPLVSNALISNVIKITLRDGAVAPVLPITDTVVKLGGDSAVVAYPSRRDLKLMQTPQGFRFGLIFKALSELRDTKADLTDDSSAVFLMGGKVTTIDGEKTNIKITTPDDLQSVDHLLSRKTFR